MGVAHLPGRRSGYLNSSVRLVCVPRTSRTWSTVQMVNRGLARKTAMFVPSFRNQAGTVFAEPNRGHSHQISQEGNEACIKCARRTCLLLVVRMSLSELSRATLVFRCSYSMGSPDRVRVRIVILMTRSSSSVKAVGCGQ